MGHQDRIAEFIARFPGRDDDEISAALGITPRQTVNQVCRALARLGVIDRRQGDSGKLGNFPLAAPSLPKQADGAPPKPQTSHGWNDSTIDWFWEGNVVDALATFLEAEGWEVLSKADTHSKQQGVDLHLRCGEKHLLIEVKGYPSRHYRNPARVGELKPTNPTNQAQHWFAHALLKALRLRSSYPASTPAIAFPDMARYRKLFAETEDSLRDLGVATMFVDEAGAVEIFGLKGEESA